MAPMPSPAGATFGVILSGSDGQATDGRHFQRRILARRSARTSPSLWPWPAGILPSLGAGL